MALNNPNLKKKAEKFAIMARLKAKKDNVVRYETFKMIIVYFVGLLVYLKRNTIVKSFYNIRIFLGILLKNPIDETPATLKDMRIILKDMQNTLKSESYKQQK